MQSLEVESFGKVLRIESDIGEKPMIRTLDEPVNGLSTKVAGDFAIWSSGRASLFRSLVIAFGGPSQGELGGEPNEGMMLFVLFGGLFLSKEVAFPLLEVGAVEFGKVEFLAQLVGFGS